MRLLLSVLLCVSLDYVNPEAIAEANPEANPEPSSEYVEKLPVIVVNEENREALGNLSLGTQLIQDQKTGLYRPPPLSRTFTPEDRIILTWNNLKSRDNFCKEGPDRLDPGNWQWKYFWNQFCMSFNGQDICCGDNLCSCYNPIIGPRFNCACLPPKDNEAYLKKQKEDFDQALKATETFGKVIAEVAGSVGKKG